MKSSKRNKKLRIIAPLVVAAILLSVGVFGIVNQQQIRDEIEGWSYTPGRVVRDIESKIGLTQAGKRVFHATHPSVISAESFNEACPRREQASPIIGCYTPKDAIFIYDITNDKLKGIRSVTAAHELMHAVWSRMSVGERERIGLLLEKEYKALTDERLDQRMQYYERAEKGQEVNELHSILGTERKNINPELEAHYAKYFDKIKVVALYDTYQAHYRAVEDESSRLVAKLQRLAGTIASKNAEYEQSVVALDRDIQAFNARANSGGFTNQAEFQNQRQRLMARSAEVDAMRIAVNAEIEEYNNLYEKYKQSAEEIKSLNDSLDSLKSLQRPSATEI